MADIPYSDWFRFALRHFPKAEKQRIAELFSGPGALATIAEQHGFEVFRVDSSLPALGKDGRRIVAEATALPLRADCFTGLLAPNGSVNYLTDGEALAAHFIECAAILCRGGAYVFDFCPAERAYGLHARHFTALKGEITFSHRFSPADQELLSAVKIHSGDGQIITELHRQHIFTPTELKSAAVAAGFEVREEAENYGLPFTGENAPMITLVLIKA